MADSCIDTFGSNKTKYIPEIDRVSNLDIKYLVNYPLINLFIFILTATHRING